MAAPARGRAAMVLLRIAGALERCSTFQEPLDLRRVAQMEPYSKNGRAYLAICRQALGPGPSPGLPCAPAPQSS
jgi:hypothetical protein